MSSLINCIVVDDEPAALNGLARYINRKEQLRIIELCENSDDAGNALRKNKIDLMFLDINMPGVNGIDFLKKLDDKPITIITSAHAEYAVDSFELDVIDFLVKPFSFERFEKALNKTVEYIEMTKLSKLKNENYLFVKCNKKIEKIFLEEIYYVEAMHNYIAIHTASERYIAYMSLKEMEDQLPTRLFTKVQRSFIVAKAKVNSISDGKIFLKDKEISISRTGRQEIIEALIGKTFGIE